jgi:hypothetical protein
VINILILDTNIYRRLGTKFFDHFEYKWLEDYCYSSAAEILLTKTVYNEYLDFYTKEVIDKNIVEVEKGYEKLRKLNRFNKIKSPNFTEQRKEEIDFIKNKLAENKLRPKLDCFLNEQQLLEFLIENKQETKKDNTRDYLIWLNALAASKLYDGDQVVIISEDKIFEENTHFQKLREKLKVRPIKIFNSIPMFLGVYGFKSELLTKEFILKHISNETIKKELIKDKVSVQSYISTLYQSESKNSNLEKIEIDDIRIQEFYSHKDIVANVVKIIAHVEVKINMIFEPERNKHLLIEHLNEIKINPSRLIETFDNNGRPIFNNWILFHFELIFSEETNKIVKVEFLDFFLDNQQFGLNDITKGA